jgi:hypothetical protein
MNQAAHQAVDQKAISASGPSRPRPALPESESPPEPAKTGDTRRHEPGDPMTTALAELDLPALAARFMSRSKVHRTWALNRESEAAPMLPPFIIDQIRRREEAERRRIERDQPRVELPVDAYRPAPRPQPDAEEPDDPDRGVVILDLG